ncbi:DUF424 family protein [Candidatus Micrarchaeota archaeon]|nr:DUF424 family protein [Candidatus Micrarchaeota archaeon]
MKVYLKIHENESGRVVAMCDAEILGNVFEEAGKLLDLKNHAGFYKGELLEEEKVLEELKNFSSVNIVGANSVEIAKKAGIIEESSTKRIGKVPYAQAYRV